MPDDAASLPSTDATDLDFDSALDAAFGSIAGELGAASAEPAAPDAEPTSAPPPADAAAPPPAEPAAEENPNILLSLFKDRYGPEFGAKYQTDEAFMDGVRETFRTIGQRDEDAMLGRQFRENPQAFLQQYGWAQTQQTAQQVAQETPAPAPPPGMGWNEVQRLKNLIRQNPETGRLEPKPGAPPDVVERYEEQQQRAMTALFDLANNPQKLVEEAARKAAEIASQQAMHYAQQQWAIAQQQAAQQQHFQTEAQAAEQWFTSRIKEFYNEGEPSRGLTPLGAAMREVFQRDFQGLVNEGRMTPTRALEAARAIVIASVPPPQPTQPVSPQAAPRPNVANGAAAGPDKWAQRPNEDIDAYQDRLWAMVAKGEMPPGAPVQ